MVHDDGTVARGSTDVERPALRRCSSDDTIRRLEETNRYSPSRLDTVARNIPRRSTARRRRESREVSPPNPRARQSAPFDDAHARDRPSDLRRTRSPSEWKTMRVKRRHALEESRRRPLRSVVFDAASGPGSTGPRRVSSTTSTGAKAIRTCSDARRRRPPSSRRIRTRMRAMRGYEQMQTSRVILRRPSRASPPRLALRGQSCRRCRISRNVPRRRDVTRLRARAPCRGTRARSAGIGTPHSFRPARSARSTPRNPDTAGTTLGSACTCPGGNIPSSRRNDGSPARGRRGGRARDDRDDRARARRQRMARPSCISTGRDRASARTTTHPASPARPRALRDRHPDNYFVERSRVASRAEIRSETPRWIRRGTPKTASRRLIPATVSTPPGRAGRSPRAWSDPRACASTLPLRDRLSSLHAAVVSVDFLAQGSRTIVSSFHSSRSLKKMSRVRLPAKFVSCSPVRASDSICRRPSSLYYRVWRRYQTMLGARTRRERNAAAAW